MPLSRKGDPTTSRAINRRLILNILRRHGPSSRVALASQTGLSAPAVTDVIADLIRQNIVVEGEKSPAALGRRPVPISVNYAAGLAVGVRIGSEHLECAATDLSTGLLTSVRHLRHDGDPASAVAAISGVVPMLVAEADRGGAPVVGVGISLSGVVDASRGICRREFRLGWTDVPLASRVAERIRLPVWLDDEVNAFAIAQQLFGVGRRHQDFVTALIGTSVGAALVTDGRIHRGAHGSAGRLGHVPHDPSGPWCRCGRRGCLVACHGDTRLVAEWGLRTGCPDASRHDLLAAAVAGDAVASAVLREAGEAIGCHLASYVDVVDPDVVVVGGESIDFGEALLDPLRTALAGRAFCAPPLQVLKWDATCWSRGAAALAMQRLFDFELSGTVAGQDAAA